jgi:outer membrane cobalamin receptor
MIPPIEHVRALRTRFSCASHNGLTICACSAVRLRLHWYRVFVLAAVLIQLLPCAVMAQQEPASDLTDKTLEELMDIRVYSASGYSQTASDAPASVSIVTHDEIEKAGFRTLADILRSVRSFYISYDRQYSYIGARGFSNPGDYNTRVLLMVDGHRMNDPLYEQAMVGTEFSIDVGMIERVEIIRGPTSSLYGTNAVFAVINVITRTPNDIKGLEFAGDAGSFNTYRGRISYGGEIGGLDVVLSGTFYGSRGHNELYYPEFDNPDSNYGIASHDDDDQFVDLLTTLSTHGFTFQAVYNAREKGDPTGSFGDVFNDPRNRESDDHGYLDLRFDHALGASSTIMAKTYFDRYINDGKFVEPVPGGSVLNKDFGRGETWGTQIQATTNIRQRYKLVSGFEYRDNFRQQLVNYDVSPPAVYLNVDHPFIVAAPYIESELPIKKSLSFDPSLREDFNPRVGWILSARAALAYTLRERTHLKLIYGRSFRSPNSYELYYNPGQASLKPERISAWEGDWDQDLPHNARFTVSVFSNEMNNFIGFVPSNLESGDFYNLGRMSTAGAEMELRGRWHNGVTGVASYSETFQQQGADNQPLFNSPKQLGKLDLSVPLLSEKLFATIDSQYTSRRATLAGAEVSPYTVVNLTLLGHHLTRGLDVSASLYNALNNRFYDPGSPQHLQDAIQQDGRNFRFKLVWTLGVK